VAGPGDVVQVDGNATYAAVRWTTSGTAAQPIRRVGLRVNGARPALQGGANTMELNADHVVVDSPWPRCRAPPRMTLTPASGSTTRGAHPPRGCTGGTRTPRVARFLRGECSGRMERR